MIYPIFDSNWISLVQVAPKIEGMTIVHNDNNELIIQSYCFRFRRSR